MDRLLADLETAVEQLPYNTRNHEAAIVANVLEQQTSRRRGSVAIGELLPAVLARLGIHVSNTKRKRGSVLNSCEDPHRLTPTMAFLPLQVHGALSDHHRLIRQFGAVPLMYYLYGET